MGSTKPSLCVSLCERLRIAPYQKGLAWKGVAQPHLHIYAGPAYVSGTISIFLQDWGIQCYKYTAFSYLTSHC